MSFKFILILIFLIVLTSCGVEGDPIPPPRTGLDPVQEKYIPKAEPQKEDSKKDEDKTSSKK